MSVAEQEQVHLPLATATCPSGHSNKTQKASGSKLRCSRCFQQNGKTVLITVPDRGASEPPGKPRRRPAQPDAPRPSSCRGCGAEAPAGRLPSGWMSVTVSADPSKTKDGKPYRRVGPYCSLSCLVGSLKGLAGQTAGVALRPGEPTEDLRSLMVQRPGTGRS